MPRRHQAASPTELPTSGQASSAGPSGGGSPGTPSSQYRRTYLGPWWITVQLVIFVAGLSLLFGILLKQDLKTFVPYVTLGFVAFNWMTGMIQGGATSIVSNGASIKTTPGPLSASPSATSPTNTIQFLHDSVVIVLVLIVFQVHMSAASCWSPLR